MRNFAVLLAMIAGFTVLMGPAIGLSLSMPQAPTQSPPALSSICVMSFARAGAHGTDDGTSGHMDVAVKSCASLREWQMAAQSHPGAIGHADPRRFLEARCRDADARLSGYATCRDLGVRRRDAAPGTVTVLAHAADHTDLEPGVGVEIILDTSGSMLEQVSGKRRIDIAKDSLTIIVRDALPEGLQVAVRTFSTAGRGPADGGRRPDRGGVRSGTGRSGGGRLGESRSSESESADAARCETGLALPLAPLDRDAALALLGRLTAGKRSSTPIAASLAAVEADLAGVTGRRTIVLVTDGDETCGGDPVAEVERLRSVGPELRLYVVGIAQKGEELKARMAQLAESGGGGYFDVSNQAELVAAIESAITGRVAIGTRVRVLSPAGKLVGRGSVGSEPIKVEPGVYQVRVLSDPPVVFDDVTVDSGEDVELELTDRV